MKNETICYQDSKEVRSLVWNNMSRDQINLIKSTIQRFKGDKFNNQYLSKARISRNNLIIPKVFQRYTEYVLFEPRNSAIIIKIPYMVGYYIEKIDGIYYMTRDYADQPIAIVRQVDIDRFGMPEAMPEDTLFEFVRYMQFELCHFGI